MVSLRLEGCSRWRSNGIFIRWPKIRVDGDFHFVLCCDDRWFASTERSVLLTGLPSAVCAMNRSFWPIESLDAPIRLKMEVPDSTFWFGESRWTPRTQLRKPAWPSLWCVPLECRPSVQISSRRIAESISSWCAKQILLQATWKVDLWGPPRREHLEDCRATPSACPKQIWTRADLALWGVEWDALPCFVYHLMRCLHRNE